MKRMLIAIGFLILASLACGHPAPEYMLRGWTVTPSPTSNAQPTQTPILVQITTTPAPTQTPDVVVVSATPETSTKCVQANVTVHLRPSANTTGYPIEVLANGEKVQDLGGRVGKWWFVSVGENQGWVDSSYLVECS